MTLLTGAITKSSGYPAKETRVVLFGLEICKISSRVCLLVQEKMYIPYFSLPGVAFFPASYKKMKQSFSNSLSALKMSKYKEAFYYAGIGIESVGNAVGSFSKTFMGLSDLIGLFAKFIFLSYISGTILPHVVMVTSSFGAVSDLYQLGNTLCTLSTWKKRTLAEKIKLLEKPKDELEIAFHKESFFANESGLKTLQEKISDLSLKARQIANLESIKDIEALNDLSQNIETMSLSELVQHIESYHAKYASSVPEKDSSAIVGLIKEAEQFTAHAESELRRKILNHILSLIICILGVSATDLSMDNSYEMEVTILTISGSITHMGFLLFDGLVSSDRFYRFIQGSHDPAKMKVEENGEK